MDRALIKNVLDIFIEVGMGAMEAYQQDFEASLLVVRPRFPAMTAWLDKKHPRWG